MNRNIRPFNNQHPNVHESSFIDPAAIVIGEVSLAADSSVWPCAVIRGDVNHIQIGARSNIQDFAMLHVTHKRDSDPLGAPLIIGEDVTIGHHVTLHGCTIHDRVLIGIGSIILDRAVIEPQVLVGAGSLVPPNKHLESGYLYLGNPVKKIRLLTEEELKYFKYSAAHYVKLAKQHQQSLNDLT